jgi:oxygen-independent coproporphyrinogen-3 oxidase
LLERIGRIHSGLEARRAFDMAREAGFDNINLDLMFGLPGQTEKTFLLDLQTAVRLGPEHISWYQLTIEPNTRFAANPPPQPTDDVLAEWTEQGAQWLERHGCHRYEVSAYATAGRQCGHNLNYWQFGDYLGIGAGAHSKITLADEQRVLRLRKTKRPGSYLQKQDKTAAQWTVETPDLIFEFMLNAMRLKAGVEASLFTRHTGLPINVIAPVMQDLMNQSLVTGWPERIELTAHGFNHLNAILEFFLPDALAKRQAQVPVQWLDAGR